MINKYLLNKKEQTVNTITFIIYIIMIVTYVAFHFFLRTKVEKACI